MPDESLLLDAAGDIADGRGVDWVSVTTSLSSAEEREIADELALIARVAAGHRQLHEIFRPATTSSSAVAFDRSRWGQLDVIDVLGRGSYGTVYRAWDSQLERLVALKLFHRAADPDAVMREGRMLARIRHENVVAVYGADVIDGVTGIWMELIHGKPLDQIVKQSGPMAPRDAAAIGVDVARALAAIHDAHLLHCDVKPQNVIRDESGRVVLMDMGAARGIPDDSNELLANVAGTPRYMAPELFKKDASSTTASDIYSAGVLLYYLVSGRFPIEAPSVVELERAHRSGGAQPLTSVREDLPPAYVGVVSRALDPNPALRPTAAELHRALEPIAAPVAARPWRVWSAIVIAAAILAGALTAFRFIGSTPPPRPIAVLPIKNLTGDASKAYVADGLTEVLISNLARVRALRVPSFAAVTQFRDSRLPPGELAKKMGVELILAGSITEVDAQFRMAVQLVDPKTGTAMWGEELTREAPGMMSAQGDIARMVANRLALNLSSDEQRALGNRRMDPRAEDAFLRGIALRSTIPTARPEVARLFREATEIDPTFAAAWAELALVETPLTELSTNADRAQRIALSRQMAERAIQLDPTVVAGHAALGTIQFYYDWDFAKAERTFAHAVAIGPSDGFVRQRFAMLLAARNRLAEAIDMAQQAARLEPFVASRHTSLGGIYYYARDFARAEAEAKLALDISPGFPTSYYELGLIAAARGQYDQAVDHMRRALNTSDYIGWQVDLARVLAAAGRIEEERQLLTALAARVKAGESYGLHNDAYIAAAEGRIDDAFSLLNKAIDLHGVDVLWLAVDPRADPLRSDPRFEALVTRAGVLR